MEKAACVDVIGMSFDRAPPTLLFDHQSSSKGSADGSSVGMTQRLGGITVVSLLGCRTADGPEKAT